MNRIYWKD